MLAVAERYLGECQCRGLPSCCPDGLLSALAWPPTVARREPDARSPGSRHGSGPFRMEGRHQGCLASPSSPRHNANSASGWVRWGNIVRRSQRLGRQWPSIADWWRSILTPTPPTSLGHSFNLSYLPSVGQSWSFVRSADPGVLGMAVSLSPFDGSKNLAARSPATTRPLIGIRDSIAV